MKEIVLRKLPIPFIIHMQKFIVLFVCLAIKVAVFGQPLTNKEIDTLTENVRKAFHVTGIAIAVINQGGQ